MTKLSEEQLIRRLRRLEKDWPKGYWLFATGNSLHLLRPGEDGARAYEERGSVDLGYEVASYSIPNDGGDF